jgi:aryl-phospho-beta-D-glucosidase BglC (GH1 family)
MAIAHAHDQPSLFQATGNDAIVDEYTFGQYQDHGVALAALTQHWGSWFTEDDFAQIAGEHRPSLRDESC